MLVPVQTTGKKPPLFFVHGMHGTMMLASMFAPALGADQPVYAIHADGIDGRRAPRANLREMVSAYVNEIHAARPFGPVLIAGICVSSMAAIEIARELHLRGRQVRPVIMIDPPPMPPGCNKQSQMIDPMQPDVAERLYNQSRRFLSRLGSGPRLPFDATDPHMVHLATLAAVASSLAFTKHIPNPFSGPTAVILSTQYAAGFFHPEMPWSKLIPRPHMVHILPYDHQRLFQAGHVVRTLKFMLKEIMMFEATVEPQAESGLA